MSCSAPDNPDVSAWIPPAWRIAAALLSGVLIVLAFPLFGSEMGLDWLVWGALTPLFFAATGQGVRRGLLLGLCAGTILEAAGFLWILLAIRRFTGMPWLLSTMGFLLWVLYSSLPWAALGGALGGCSRPHRVLWVLPFWVGLEHCFPRLFPWHLGGALHARQWLVQTVDIWGASGLTALVFLASACFYLGGLSALRRERFPLAATVALAVLTAGALGYGALRLDQVRRLEKAAPLLRVALIQGALSPDRRGREGLEYYLEATEQVLERGGVDLVVWPEGAVSGAEWPPFDLTPGRGPRGVRGGQAAVALARKVEELGVPLVAGGTGYDATRLPPVSNVLAYFQPGRLPAFYEKNIRVPGGEYVPLLDHLPESWRRRFAHIGTLAAGTTNPRLSLDDHSFRSLICYEAVLPGFVARTAAGTDFLVNITEDVWYGRTAHIPQHVSVLRLRVVENRTPVVRCTNMGPSGVFTPSGRFLSSGAVFEPAADIVAFGMGRLSTVYGLWGRFLPVGFLCFAVGWWVFTRIRPGRQLPKMS